MKFVVAPRGGVKVSDVSSLLSDGKYDLEADGGSLKLSHTFENGPSGNKMNASVAADVKLPIASAAAALQGSKPSLKGAEITLKRDAIKLSSDVEALLSKTPAESLKVEYSTNTNVGGRKVDVKAKYAVKRHAATIEAGTKLDANTKLHATYAIKTKALKGKLTYVFDATTLDATHEFSTGKTQLDITRKLEGSDTYVFLYSRKHLYIYISHTCCSNSVFIHTWRVSMRVHHVHMSRCDLFRAVGFSDADVSLPNLSSHTYIHIYMHVCVRVCVCVCVCVCVSFSLCLFA